MQLNLVLLVGVLGRQRLGHVSAEIWQRRILPSLFLDPLLDDVQVGDGTALRVGLVLLAVALQRRDDVDEELVGAQDYPDLSALVLQAAVWQLDLLLVAVVRDVVDPGPVLNDEDHSPVGRRLERCLVAGLLLVVSEDGQVEQVRVDEQALQAGHHAQLKTKNLGLGVSRQGDGSWKQLFSVENLG